MRCAPEEESSGAHVFLPWPVGEYWEKWERCEYWAACGVGLGNGKDGLVERTRLKWPLPKDVLLRCERRLFTLQYTSFCNVRIGNLKKR